MQEGRVSTVERQAFFALRGPRGDPASHAVLFARLNRVERIPNAPTFASQVTALSRGAENGATGKIVMRDL